MFAKTVAIAHQVTAWLYTANGGAQHKVWAVKTPTVESNDRVGGLTAAGSGFFGNFVPKCLQYLAFISVVYSGLGVIAFKIGACWLVAIFVVYKNCPGFVVGCPHTDGYDGAGCRIESERISDNLRRICRVFCCFLPTLFSFQ